MSVEDILKPKNLKKTNGEKFLTVNKDFDMVEAKRYILQQTENAYDKILYIEDIAKVGGALESPLIIHKIGNIEFLVPMGKKPDKAKPGYMSLAGLGYKPKAKLQKGYKVTMVPLPIDSRESPSLEEAIEEKGYDTLRSIIKRGENVLAVLQKEITYNQETLGIMVKTEGADTKNEQRYKVTTQKTIEFPEDKTGLVGVELGIQFLVEVSYTEALIVREFAANAKLRVDPKGNADAYDLQDFVAKMQLKYNKMKARFEGEATYGVRGAMRFDTLKKVNYEKSLENILIAFRIPEKAKSSHKEYFKTKSLMPVSAEKRPDIFIYNSLKPR